MNRATEAHTIVTVAPEILMVPAYLRRQSSPKVILGSAYRPKPVITPAIEVYPSAPSILKDVVTLGVFIFAVGSAAILLSSYLMR